MTLSEEAESRLADVVELQPTKNSELQERWDMDSGSEVHGYLESELKEYYYRDDNSLIRATEDAAELVDVEPGIDPGENGQDGVPSTIRVPELQSQIVAVLAEPEERAQSVVSVLHDLREEFDVDPDPDDVRAGLQRLRQKNVVEAVYRSVPTFKLAVERDELTVERTS
jgi:hypothetical protein